ncbi:hypothetical protein T4D_12002 [Trichinella pseudospiralis]|uniref:Uncharacterized protein n=1 Tax=Trichinella pseudospiralis TaxID=6337 RepID=A0A0V1FWZ7_TRIPS|nr:hypothetical protein T4D_12002 [Trichinella pseudospiralis]
MGFYCYLRENPTSEYSCTFRNHYIQFVVQFVKFCGDTLVYGGCSTKHYGENESARLLGSNY